LVVFFFFVPEDVVDVDVDVFLFVEVFLFVPDLRFFVTFLFFVVRRFLTGFFGGEL
jgi:hypothetical protein